MPLTPKEVFENSNAECLADYEARIAVATSTTEMDEALYVLEQCLAQALKAYKAAIA